MIVEVYIHNFIQKMFKNTSGICKKKICFLFDIFYLLSYWYNLNKYTKYVSYIFYENE